MEGDSAKRPDFIEFVNHSGKVNFKKNAFNDGKQIFLHGFTSLYLFGHFTSIIPDPQQLQSIIPSGLAPR